jgi:hypothetical protein
MKKLIILTAIMLTFGSHKAFAEDPAVHMAQSTLKANGTKNERLKKLIALYNSEAAKPDSELASFLKKLKASDESVATQITAQDVVFDSSAKANPSFYGETYYILVRTRSKADSSIVAWLNASGNSKDKEKTIITTIYGEVKVTFQE